VDSALATAGALYVICIVKLDEENLTSASLAQEIGPHNCCTGRCGW
jgi:hypothetical protein